MGFNNRGFHSGCPCKDCEHRTMTCHGVCTKYSEWKKQEDEKKKARDADRERFNTMSDAKKKAIWRKMRYSRQNPKNNHREG